MTSGSAIVTDSSYTTGVGKYSWYLFNLGLIENLFYFPFIYKGFFHYTYKNKEDFKKNNYNSKENYFSHIKSGFNLLYIYYFGEIYKKAIERMNFVHVAEQHDIFLVKYNKNTIATIHDFFELTYLYNKFPYNKSYLHFIKMNLKKFTPKLKAVVVNSDRVKEEAEEMFPDVYFKRIHLWLDDPNFKPRDKIEVRKKLGLKDDKIYLLNISGDHPRKNIDILPNILNKLDERFVLIRIGDSERILSKFKNKNQIIWLKNVPDDIYPLYFSAADVLIHPVLDGGFEIPYLEAIFSDLPVITFDIPIAREVLRDKGIFVNLGKDKLDPDEWVDKILKYYDHRPNYDDLKKYYSKERAKREYEDLYRSLGFL